MPNPKGDNLGSILGDPCLFPFDLDEQSGEVVFVPTNREKLSKASFLDGREPFSTAPGEKRQPIKDLQTRLEKEPLPGNKQNFIFHTGFCCSTLLARCLDQEGVCISLKEPKILNALSQTRHFGFSGNGTTAHLKKLELCLSLLSRKFSNNEEIIIKPSNVETVLLDDILSLNPNLKMVFLFSDLKSFLISVAKGGQPRRDFVRRLLAHFLADFKTRENYDPNFFGMQEGLIWNFSDLHIAAAAWFLQMKYFEETAGKNIYWLNSKDFLREPTNTVRKLYSFFGFQSGKQNPENDELLGKLSCHAKAPNFPYSPAKRKTEFTALENYLSPVLPEIINWAERAFPEGEKNQHLQIAV